MALFNEENIFIVTGASSGIGKAVAKKLIEENAKVLAIARNSERLQLLERECSKPKNLFIETTDLTEHLVDMPSYLNFLKSKYGKFSGLAYCAGYIMLKPALTTEYEESLNLFNINYFAPVMMIKSFMDKRICIGKGASAVAVASATAFLREKGLCIYSGTKAALQVSLATIAKEVASKGMRVNTVSPSDIKTPMTMNDDMLNLRQGREKTYPFGFGEPNDVAEIVVFLLSNKAKWLTGHDYIIDCASF
ncbi:MAG: SDR family oxidoreductase [Spirochaetaceae bacterium]|nr:SDR family oxidoreductase [Spirochaetaceae bacterium]